MMIKPLYGTTSDVPRIPLCHLKLRAKNISMDLQVACREYHYGTTSGMPIIPPTFYPHHERYLENEHYLLFRFVRHRLYLETIGREFTLYRSIQNVPHSLRINSYNTKGFINFCS